MRAPSRRTRRGRPPRNESPPCRRSRPLAQFKTSEAPSHVHGPERGYASCLLRPAASLRRDRTALAAGRPRRCWGRGAGCCVGPAWKKARASNPGGDATWRGRRAEPAAWRIQSRSGSFARQWVTHRNQTFRYAPNSDKKNPAN
jgi:hypothetical protein